MTIMTLFLASRLRWEHRGRLICEEQSAHFFRLEDSRMQLPVCTAWQVQNISLLLKAHKPRQARSGK